MLWAPGCVISLGVRDTLRTRGKVRRIYRKRWYGKYWRDRCNCARTRDSIGHSGKGLRVPKSLKNVFIVVSFVRMKLGQGRCGHGPDPVVEAHFLYPNLSGVCILIPSVVDRDQIKRQVRRIHTECSHESR